MSNSYSSPPSLVDPSRVTAGLTLRATEISKLGELQNYSLLVVVVLMQSLKLGVMQRLELMQQVRQIFANGTFQDQATITTSLSLGLRVIARHQETKWEGELPFHCHLIVMNQKW